MASQSSYIKHRPSLLQPSAGGGCWAPLATLPLRGHARPRARERESERERRAPALCPLPCDSLFLSGACNSQPKPDPQIFFFFFGWARFLKSEGLISPPLSHMHAHAPLSRSSELLGELCSFKGSELDQILRKLLRYQYFLNELNVTRGC